MIRTIKDNYIYIIILVALVVLMLWAFVGGMGKVADNQSVMLCNSALKSGNVEWSIKCVDYYRTGNVEDIKEEGR